MTLKSTRPSIYDLPPRERGGVVARQGFTFQDHVAVGLCLDMLTSNELIEVWCESQDDITLIWEKDSEKEAEFVQVKSNKLDGLWSVGELCQRDKSKVGSSILEKSLAYDCCKESSCFRIVTLWPVNRDLEILTSPIDSFKRNSSRNELQELSTKIEKKLGTVNSDNGNSSNFWVERVEWYVEHDLDALKRKNLEKLRKFLEMQDCRLPDDQLEEKIYNPLIWKVQKAADAEWKDDPNAKIIKREEFREVILHLVDQTQLLGVGGISGKLKEKLVKANLPSDMISTAFDLRIRFRRARLQPGYLEVSEYERMEGEVVAILQQLRAKLDAGELSGQEENFHNFCLSKLEDLRTNFQKDFKLDFHLIQGCMYDITDRCMHRFVRYAA